MALDRKVDAARRELRRRRKARRRRARLEKRAGPYERHFMRRRRGQANSAPQLKGLSSRWS